MRSAPDAGCDFDDPGLGQGEDPRVVVCSGETLTSRR
jgi:hypothetical protein